MTYRLPIYIKALNLSALSVDYTWDNEIFNKFWIAHDESSPRLATAINTINGKAAFALAVACSEWVAARVENYIDTSDALLRIEAGWAAVADWRYASLPTPPPNPPTVIKEFASPLRLAMRLMAHAHELYSTNSQDVNSRTQGLIMLTEHIAGRHPAFEPWLIESLRRCRDHFPDIDLPMEKQPLVPKEFFEPSFVWMNGAAEESLVSFLQTLDPLKNPYLRTPEQMQADGFKGSPYGGSL